MIGKLIALIPARSGSERIKDKNLVKIKGKSLLEITIKNAISSKIFDKIIVSTDSKKYAKIAKNCGAEVPFLRPNKFSGSISPDFEWVSYTLKKLDCLNKGYSHFFILRPTSPFRTHKTIIRAWKKFRTTKGIDSLRAVEVCKQHPYKMWIKNKKIISPLFNKKFSNQPSYNVQFKSLPIIYVQNACIEISKLNVLNKYNSITGKKITPFFTNKIEGIDINYKEDIFFVKNIAKNRRL